MRKLLTLLCLFIGLNSFANQHSVAEQTFNELCNMEQLNEDIVKEKIAPLKFKERVALAKLAIKQLKSKESFGVRGPSVGMYILAVILPPLAVWLYTGDTNITLINLLLTLIGWLPGVVHALVFVLGV